MSISTDHIVRRRGDTLPVQVCVKDLVGAIEDIDNSTFVLTVGTEPYPATIGTSIFEVEGVINGPSTDGLVDFAIEGGNELHVGFYYFDVEMVDSTGITDTILYGWYEVKQDKTKSDETFEWTPDASYVDGAQVVADGTEDWLICSMTFPDWGSTGSLTELTYNGRDGRKVLRNEVKAQTQYTHVMHHPLGPGFPRHQFHSPGWEWRATAYINQALFAVYFLPGDGVSFAILGVDTRGSVVAIESSSAYLLDPTKGGVTQTTMTPPDTSGWPVAGWYEIGYRYDLNSKFWVTIHPEGDSDNWIEVFPTLTIPAVHFEKGVPAPYIRTNRESPEVAASIVDIWKYEWRRLS